ncbi:MAG: hypothetical protein ACFFEO_17275, partial [Candidatus Thorarchaeota archaeon]
MSTTNNDLEMDFYIKIINFFKNQPSTDETIEIWKDNSLIELMKVLERTENKKIIQNAIILLISLFEQIPPDLYNNKGRNSKLIDEKEKKAYLNLMKSEFL